MWDNVICGGFGCWNEGDVMVAVMLKLVNKNPDDGYE